MAIKWILDPTHSEISFKVRHMMISNVKGQFKDFSGEIESEDDSFENAKAKAIIKADSIDTNNADRDEHLKKADFFNTEKNPEILFESDTMNGKTTGNLTMNGITKSITLDVEFGGIGKNMYGQTKAGFSFEGLLNRKDFGINFNATMETGGVMLGDEVKISGELQFVKE